MNEGERSGLAVMRDCWLGGGMAADLAPPEWKEIVAEASPADRERLLLAIAGQALDVGFRPAAPKTLAGRAPLPRLALPTVPERLRLLFRAALKQADDEPGRMRIAALAAARGFVAHPLDWMPAAPDFDAPSVYAPWVDWLAQGDGKSPRGVGELNVERWDEFYPAARRIALAGIRRSDPAKARSLLEAKVAGEPSGTRLALIELLRDNLSAADVPYLESLSADRSRKVRQLAARLLARTGHGHAPDEAIAEAAELAGFIAPGRAGWLRRRKVYAPRDLKEAQLQRRGELFETCQFIDLARSLGASEQELIAGWQLGVDENVDRRFTDMVLASGSDKAVAQMAERLFAVGDVASLQEFVPRLGEAARRKFIKAVLAGDGGSLEFLDGDEIAMGGFDRDELMGSRCYKEIRADIPVRVEEERWMTDPTVLGFLATASAADAIVQDLVSAGLAPADPQLAVLRLNAGLGQSRLEENKR